MKEVLDYKLRHTFPSRICSACIGIRVLQTPQAAPQIKSLPWNRMRWIKDWMVYVAVSPPTVLAALRWDVNVNEAPDNMTQILTLSSLCIIESAWIMKSVRSAQIRSDILISPISSVISLLHLSISRNPITRFGWWISYPQKLFTGPNYDYNLSSKTHNAPLVTEVKYVCWDFPWPPR
jgi:hypothetical protein